MGLTKILILCIFFLHIEALLVAHRRYGQKDEKRSNDIKRHHYDKHIDELKYKILRDRNDVQETLPPYLRKRNRRYKSIYESMHEKKPQTSQYGHLEYQQFLSRNEIPDVDLLTQLLKKSLKSIEGDEHHHKHHKKHHHYTRSHHQRIKKLRSKPEAGIMQKKLKI